MDSTYIPSINAALSNSYVFLNNMRVDQSGLRPFSSSYGDSIYVDFKDESEELRFRFEATKAGKITHMNVYEYVLSQYDEYAVNMTIVNTLIQRGRDLIEEFVGKKELDLFMDASGDPMLRLQDSKMSNWVCLFAYPGELEVTGRDATTLSLRVRLRS